MLGDKVCFTLPNALLVFGVVKRQASDKLIILAHNGNTFQVPTRLVELAHSDILPPIAKTAKLVGNVWIIG